jgi:hypothetical protein
MEVGVRRCAPGAPDPQVMSHKVCFAWRSWQKSDSLPRRMRVVYVKFCKMDVGVSSVLLACFLQQ